jgi:hypothetical protein
MTEINYESVLEQARQLPFNERQRLLDRLAEELQAPSHQNNNPVQVAAAHLERNREEQWLKEHAQEYIGQWVALSGDQLIATGNNGVEVFAAAKAQGVDRPLLFQVEPAGSHPFGF